MMRMGFGFAGPAVAAFLLSAMLSGCMLMHGREGGCMGGHGDGHPGEPARAACPVCGSSLEVAETTPRATHGGRLYYFASEEHQREFVLEPERFLRKP